MLRGSIQKCLNLLINENKLSINKLNFLFMEMLSLYNYEKFFDLYLEKNLFKCESECESCLLLCLECEC